METVKIKANTALGYKIINADDPRAVAPKSPLTRESIAAMKKAEIVELLEAHGVEKPAGPVAELRKRALSVVFLEV